METKVLLEKVEGNLKLTLNENTFSEGSKNYSIVETLISGNSALPDGSELSHDVYDTLRIAKNHFGTIPSTKIKEKQEVSN